MKAMGLAALDKQIFEEKTTTNLLAP